MISYSLFPSILAISSTKKMSIIGHWDSRSPIFTQIVSVLLVYSLQGSWSSGHSKVIGSTRTVSIKFGPPHLPHKSAPSVSLLISIESRDSIFCWPFYLQKFSSLSSSRVSVEIVLVPSSLWVMHISLVPGHYRLIRGSYPSRHLRAGKLDISDSWESEEDYRVSKSSTLLLFSKPSV